MGEDEGQSSASSKRVPFSQSRQQGVSEETTYRRTVAGEVVEERRVRRSSSTGDLGGPARMPPLPQFPPFPRVGDWEAQQRFFQSVLSQMGQMGSNTAAMPVGEVPVTLEDAASGAVVPLTLGDGRRVSVTVPAGADDGDVVAAEGAPVRIKVLPHPRFGRRGGALSVAGPISAEVARAGGEVTVPTLGGGWIRVRVPPGVPPGAYLRVTGKGMPDPRGGQAGDLFIQIQVASPGQR